MTTGKGSNIRPFDQTKWDENYDLIFRKPLGPLATAAKQRPTNFHELSPQEQRDIDKRLDILDWSGDPSE